MSSGHIGHVSPIRTYILIWAALMVGTILTVAASMVDFPGPMNAVVALAIATVKATLVVLFFMHVKYISYKVNIIVIVSAIFWLLLLLGMVSIDYVGRAFS